ncbi:MAG: hypothetical protein ABUM26_05715 [Solirubrobacterales bacterium]
MPRRWISAVPFVLLALVLAVAGCGADEEGGGSSGVAAEQQVREVVARFGVATRGKDYQEICDRLLSEELVNKIEGIGLPCESALQRGLGGVRNPTLTINEVSISGDRAWKPEQVLTGAEIRAAIDAVYPLEAAERDPHATARVHRFADGRGRIGFINPVSEPFCDDCNRIRLTADGRLRTCLFSLNETDLRGPLRAGATDDDLEQLIRDAVWAKELKHHVNDPGFVQPARTMSAIGG